MKYNFIVDFKENGMDKNRSHIVIGAESEILAGMLLKKEYDDMGCDVFTIAVVDGDYTNEQLYAMANHGIGLDRAKARLIYVSNEAQEYFKKLYKNPKEAKKLREELNAKLMR